MSEVQEKKQRTDPELAGEPTEGDAIPKSLTSSAVVYGVVEIRDRILRLLEKRELVSFMRASKEAMEHASRVLYEKISYRVYDLVRRVASKDRRNVYLSSILEIKAGSNMVPPKRLWPALDRHHHIPDGPDKKELLRDWLKVYHPSAMKVIVTYLRSSCPRLRVIYFGQHVRGYVDREAWTVRCQKPRLAATPGSGSAVFFTDDTHGHIDIFRTLTFTLARSPPATISAPPPPSEGYTTTLHFNLRLTPALPPDVPLYNQWLKALREDPQFAEHLYRLVDTSDLPIGLADLTRLAQGQKDARLEFQLGHVIAPALRPWAVRDLQSFAAVAPGTLRTLILGQTDVFGGEAAGSSFDDLPQIMATVTTSLPSLATLRFHLIGIENAETVCGGLLSSTTLITHGSLSDLTITSMPLPTPLFDTLRYLSSFCRRDGTVTISRLGSDTWSREAQYAYQAYLQLQDEHRRRHLGNVNFARLDIFDPANLPDLTYDQEGRPNRLREVKADKWTEQAAAIKQASIEALAGLTQFTEGSKTFQESSRLPAGRNVLYREARQLREFASYAEFKAVQAASLAQQARADIQHFMDSVIPAMPEEAQDEPLLLGTLADTSTGAARASASSSSTHSEQDSESGESAADAESKAEEEVSMD